MQPISAIKNNKRIFTTIEKHSHIIIRLSYFSRNNVKYYWWIREVQIKVNEIFYEIPDFQIFTLDVLIAIDCSYKPFVDNYNKEEMNLHLFKHRIEFLSECSQLVQFTSKIIIIFTTIGKSSYYHILPGII